MIRYITSYFYEYEFNTLTPNSMYKLNKNKFVNISFLNFKIFNMTS